MPYRVTTEDGYTEFSDHDIAIAYHAEHGIGEIEPFEIQAPDWNKEAYEQELNAAHDRWFEAIYRPLEYKSAEEIALWEDEEEFAEEANSLKGLYKTSWCLVKAHLTTVTEETANVEAFIQSLPTL